MPAQRSDEITEVVKWYTHARRFPQLIGKTPSGGQIWGGPYTATQLFAAVAIVVVGAKTISWWGRFGLIGNVIVLLAVAYGAALFLGRIPAGARNPLSLGAGLIRALSAPPAGRRAGSPVRIRRPHRVCSHVVVNTTRPAPPAVALPAPARARRFLGWSHPAVSAAAQGSVAASRLRPTPASGRTTPQASLSGVQQLLAASGSRHQET